MFGSASMPNFEISPEGRKKENGIRAKNRFLFVRPLQVDFVIRAILNWMQQKWTFCKAQRVQASRYNKPLPPSHPQNQAITPYHLSIVARLKKQHAKRKKGGNTHGISCAILK